MRFFHPSFRLLALAVALIACGMQLRAAISEGTLTTNAVQAEQRRIELFYHAQQSYQEKLQAGQRRYNDRQSARARVIASMSAQMHAREETIPVQPVAAIDATTEINIHASRPWLWITGLVLLLAGIIYYWNKPRPASESRVPYQPLDFDTQRRFLNEAAKARAKAQDSSA